MGSYGVVGLARVVGGVEVGDRCGAGLRLWRTESTSDNEDAVCCLDRVDIPSGVFGVESITLTFGSERIVWGSISSAPLLDAADAPDAVHTRAAMVLSVHRRQEELHKQNSIAALWCIQIHSDIQTRPAPLHSPASLLFVARDSRGHSSRRHTHLSRSASPLQLRIFRGCR